jgi:hypothetical protein
VVTCMCKHPPSASSRLHPPRKPGGGGGQAGSGYRLPVQKRQAGSPLLPQSLAEPSRLSRVISTVCMRVCVCVWMTVTPNRNFPKKKRGGLPQSRGLRGPARFLNRPAVLHCYVGQRSSAVPLIPSCSSARLPFSAAAAHHARVASASAANVLSLFPLSLPLQPHVLSHLLVRCLQKCRGQAPASSAGRFVRQLRCNGETVPAAAARPLSCSCLRCLLLPSLLVTRCCADCGVLCMRCGGRADAVCVVEDG